MVVICLLWSLAAGLDESLRFFEMTTSDECSQVVFQTDTLSKPEALGDGKLDQLREALQQVSRHRRTVPQRVPSHCGIPGNEAEDKRAELGAAELQKDTALSLSLSLSL